MQEKLGPMGPIIGPVWFDDRSEISKSKLQREKMVPLYVVEQKGKIVLAVSDWQAKG